jgi:hypothetical protein
LPRACAFPAALFLLDGLRGLRQALHFQPLCCFEERRQLILRHVDLARVHELEDGRQVLEGDVFEDDDWVLGWVLLEKSFEVGRARREDHFVGSGPAFARLSIARERDVREGLLVAQVLEGRDHVGLEVVPSQTELLLVSGLGHADARVVLRRASFEGGENSEAATNGDENLCARFDPEMDAE